MNVFVTSDSHFNHGNIIKYCDRPFQDAQQMNEHMIRVWNDRIKSDDIVYHLGDFYFGAKNHMHMSMDELMSRLNGEKHLIVGNHDIERHFDGDAKVPEHSGWESVQTYKELKYGKTRFVLCHYPLETWRNAHKGWFMLHGHSHGSLKRVIAHRMDVGVDCHEDYAPFALNEIRDVLKAQDDYEPSDHHGD